MSTFEAHCMKMMRRERGNLPGMIACGLDHRPHQLGMECPMGSINGKEIAGQLVGVKVSFQRKEFPLIIFQREDVPH